MATSIYVRVCIWHFVVFMCIFRDSINECMGVTCMFIVNAPNSVNMICWLIITIFDAEQTRNSHITSKTLWTIYSVYHQIWRICKNIHETITFFWNTNSYVVRWSIILQWIWCARFFFTNEIHIKFYSVWVMLSLSQHCHIGF